MKLHYKAYGTGRPIVILHGLFGMGDNWRTFARMTEHQATSILVDLRNHGRSPHSEEMSYAAMAADVRALLEELGLTSAVIMGHSMGGKVAMTLALETPGAVERLIVVDIAPRAYAPHHQDVIRAISSITPADLLSREGVEIRLASILGDDATTVQFLMKNLTRDEQGRLQWKSNIPVLLTAYTHIVEAITAPHAFEGPTAFIRGERSSYIRDTDLPGIHALFPSAELITIPGAGHWVHADQPRAFADAVLGLLDRRAPEDMLCSGASES